MRYEPKSKIRATIDYLRACQALRASGRPVAYTTDPAWLLDMAIGRRAGWVEDPHARGICQPVNGKLPRYATGDAQRELARVGHELNTPRLIVRTQSLGVWRSYLIRRVPERLTLPEQD